MREAYVAAHRRWAASPAGVGSGGLLGRAVEPERLGDLVTEVVRLVLAREPPDAHVVGEGFSASTASVFSAA